MSGCRIAPLAVALCFTGALPNAVHSAGFSLIEQNASGMGNAFAGAAAVAEDASTIWFNPAGLTRLEGHQVLVAGHVISPTIKFKDGGTSIAGLSQSGDNGGNAADLAVVPNLYFSMSLSERLKLGVGLNVPFGLLTDYDANFVGRFQGLKSEIKTVNLNPTIAYKISEVVSIGGGLNYQKVEAELTARTPPSSTTVANGFSMLEADDTQFGFNIGALFNLGEDMRLGVSYRSAMAYEVEGTATSLTSTGAVLGSRAIKADVELPAIAALSIVQTYSPEWDLLGDVTWTKWSSIQSVDIRDANTGGAVQSLQLRLKDAWRLSLGVNYRPNDQWVVKGGIAWDQAPVQDEHRTVRLPDTDRYWLSLGAKYRLSKTASIDAGYVHIFGANAPIDQNLGNTAGFGRVIGEYDLSVDILSVQASFAF